MRAARGTHWRTRALAIAATFILAMAGSTASAEDMKPAEAAAATDSSDMQGCPYAKDGAPCCTSCREKAAQAASGDAKAAAAEADEGGCPCQRRARLQQKLQEQQGQTSAP
jgi:hypothetical protein